MLDSGLCGPLQSDAFPIWLGGVSAFLASITALIVYASTVRDQRRAQARQVSCILEATYLRPAGYQWDREDTNIVVSEADTKTKVSPTPRGTARVRLNSKARELHTAFVNGSNEEISRVRCDVLNPDGSVLHESLWARLSVPPNFSFSGTAHMNDTKMLDMDGTRSMVRLLFTDASGRKWERESGKPLKRLRGGYECDPASGDIPLDARVISIPASP